MNNLFKEFKRFWLFLMVATMSVAFTACGDDDDEPSAGQVTPTPTPTPDPGDDNTKPSINSPSVFTDKTGQKFVVSEVRFGNYVEKYQYDRNGRLILINSGGKLISFDYDSNTGSVYDVSASSDEESESADFNFSVNESGYFTSISLTGNTWNKRINFVYKDDYLEKFTILSKEIYNGKEHIEEHLGEFNWKDGSIDNFSEEFFHDGTMSNKYQYTLVNSIDNHCKQYIWFEDLFDLFTGDSGLYLCGLLGKAPSKLPILKITKSLAEGNYWSATYEMDYKFDSFGRILNVLCDNADFSQTFSYSNF